MSALNIGLDSWIIQDGNYADFAIGQEARFALEFYPLSLRPSMLESHSAANLDAVRYRVSGQVIFCDSDVWVIDVGFLAYQQSQPPDSVTKGSWVQGEINLGIDPYMYFEGLKNRSGMPTLTYTFRIDEIMIETTAWLTEWDESGRKIMHRDTQKVSYREILKTDAWDDDDGNAFYVLVCSEIEGRIGLTLGAELPDRVS